ncbi:hypothetical protein QBC36DRAFT_307790 [Triangularia setosa]|uniref:Uncharacterized protein n=1 Tax=Triangularia setosa TaxID=2587417 RepID=A0AAN6WH05_9PEZI|nr:hypothetical protein QBC36DRAFT_307790 [Podospora setosa]
MAADNEKAHNRSNSTTSKASYAHHDGEREVLDRETTHKWSNPRHGRDSCQWRPNLLQESFCIAENTWLIGLTNGKPYLCRAIIGCWVTEPMNKRFGRRGTIFISCAIFGAGMLLASIHKHLVAYVYCSVFLGVRNRTKERDDTDFRSGVLPAKVERSAGYGELPLLPLDSWHPPFAMANVDSLQEQTTASIGTRKRIKEVFTIRCNRNAMIASEIVMFMQQFCGVNVIAYFSSEIFREAGYIEVEALATSLGFGVINFLFALPAFYTIDTYGCRNLLLTTFPLSVYSPGEGPVPFTYSAEAYPLYIRAIGMSFATATTWFFNFVLALTWPSMLEAFKPQGAFGWYAGWNIIGLDGSEIEGVFGGEEGDCGGSRWD